MFLFRNARTRGFAVSLLEGFSSAM